MFVSLHHPDMILRGSIELDGSKSISNRVLIIKALCDEDFPVRHLSHSDDTKKLQSLLESNGDVLDAGNAGTVFRFLTAFLCLQEKEVILTGSERMRERPVGPLVEALRQIGARIEYKGKVDYPPLQILPSHIGRFDRSVRIRGDLSSQFISALMLIGPCLPDGLDITITGKIASGPYLELTAAIMRSFGAQVEVSGKKINVGAEKYKARDYIVEPDYSGASYHFALAALAEKAEILLRRLPGKSIQGDAIIREWARDFHVESHISEEGMMLARKEGDDPREPAWNFLHNPDLFQTMAALCAVKGIDAKFHGLDNLGIKETDRVRAMAVELEKIGIDLLPIAGDPHSWKCQGEPLWPEWPTRLVFDSFGDHRMAMALSLAGMRSEIDIDDAGVVSKSYPGFWMDLERLGFQVG